MKPHRIDTRRRWLLAAALAAPGLVLAQAPWAPTKAVQLVVPFSAGGVTDLLARVVAKELQAALAQPVVVVNKPGAGGIIASESVKNAAPDGHTIMMGHIGTHAVNPALYAKLPYDCVNDFVPISLVAATPVALFAGPNVRGTTLQDVIAASRGAPHPMSFASFGAGSSSHLYAKVLQSVAGVSWLHVPYKGPVPAMQDLIGGQVDFMFDTLASGMPQVKAGKIRAIAVASRSRSALTPDTPTFGELGLKGLDGGPWFALFAPKGTPGPAVQRLSAEVQKVLAAKATADLLAAQGIAVINGSATELAVFQKKEIARWAEDVKRFNIKAE